MNRPSLKLCSWKITILSLLGTLGACAWVPMDKNPSRIRSPERLAYEACMNRNARDVSKCQKERHALLMRQEVEMMSSDS
jgi:hypothetical protein